MTCTLFLSPLVIWITIIPKYYVLSSNNLTGFTLPTLPNGIRTADYEETTNYHWGFFGDERSMEVKGPFQFGKGLNLYEGQCSLKEGFQKPGDGCIKNLRECSKGFSMSVFVKISYTPSISMLKSTKDNMEYLMSTGGEVGRSGASIFMKGTTIGGLVSLGDEYWNVVAEGLLPHPNVWTNIGITWEMPTFSTEKEYLDKLKNNQSLGGLQLFLDTERVAFSLLNRTCYSTEIQSNDCTDKIDKVLSPLNPPRLTLGCHATSQEGRNKGNIKRDISFDEPAIWTKALRRNEQIYLWGGYKKSLENMLFSEKMDWMSHVQIRDQRELESASSILMTLINENRNNTQIEEQSNKESDMTILEKVIKIMNKILDTESLKGMKLNRRDLEIILGSIIPFPTVINLKKSDLAPDWNRLHMNSSKPDAHKLRERIENYLLESLECRNLKNEAQWREQEFLVSHLELRNQYLVLSEMHNVPYDFDDTLTPDYVKYYSSDNYAIQLMSVSIGVLEKRSLFQRNTFQFPHWDLPAWEKARKLWGETVEPAESVKIPLIITDKDCNPSKRDMINYALSVYDTFPDSENKNPSYFITNKALLISRVFSLKISHSPFIKGKSPCPLNEEHLNILVTLSHKIPLIQSLVFQKNPLKTRIKSIHCAVWNKHIGINGGWDIENIRILYSDEILSNCIASKIGTYGILAQLYDEPSLTPDPVWLLIFKYLGHILSILSLIFFIGGMVFSRADWDMFQCLSLSIASGLMGGHLFMLFSELEIVRQNLCPCSIAGLSILLFYVASAVGILLKSYALLEAITVGIIRGRTLNYLTISWGCGVALLGYMLAMQGEEMGLGPRCMISHLPDVQWIFFWTYDVHQHG
ncbi:uncharacterized protein [Lepeophtheirus salmonis]|uniref:uncharacterized protein isoform X2 n=1 Tax=Lepeophtheirus salmonis TaxID=72036 RepID=UPI003AF38634